MHTDVLTRDLSAALAGDTDELSVVYMPTVRLLDGAATGSEALVRWEHPRLGPLAPSVFVPLAERTGQIAALGAFVRRAAFAHAGSAERDCGRVAVNVSGVELSDPAFSDTVLDELDAAGVTGEQVSVEVTETSLLGEPRAAAESLARLRAAGVWIALDDFGTGHSSLTYLTTLPCDIVKIDRSFVSHLGVEPRAEHVVRAVIGLARALSMTLIAEGVETYEQRDTLSLWGCGEGQGFLFGRPAAAPAHGIGAAPATARAASALRRGSDLDPQLLVDLVADVQAAPSLDHAFTIVLGALRTVVAFTGASVQVLGEDGIRLAVAYPPPTPEARAARIPAGQGVGGGVISTGQLRYLPDITAPAAQVPAQRRSESVSRHTRSYLAVPLAHQGVPFGLLQIDSVEPDAFGPAVGLLLASVSGPLALAARQSPGTVSPGHPW